MQNEHVGYVARHDAASQRPVKLGEIIRLSAKLRR